MPDDFHWWRSKASCASAPFEMIDAAYARPGGTKRVCSVPSCPNLTDRGRCADHRRRHEIERGTRQARGYDAAYDRLRRSIQARMDAGEAFACWRCAEAGTPHPVDPQDWTLGHDDHDRTIVRGPECPAGNYATTGRQTTRPRPAARPAGRGA